jgi:acyl dehydratase
VTATAATAKGDELDPTTVRITRADLVRYAGASGDFNPIHWSDRFATGVGLPGVIAHGMLTMALAGRFVTAWAGGPAAVRSLGVRFTRPVVVPDDDEGAAVELSGVVSGVSGAGVATVTVTAKFDGRTVLGKATAEVLLPS